MSDGEPPHPFQLKITRTGAFCAIRVTVHRYARADKGAKAVATGAYGVVVRKKDHLIGYSGYGGIRDPHVLYAYGLLAVITDPTLDPEIKRLGLVVLTKRTGFATRLREVAASWKEYSGLNTRDRELEGREAWETLVREFKEGRLDFVAKGGHSLPELTRRAQQLADRCSELADREGAVRRPGSMIVCKTEYE